MARSSSAAGRKPSATLHAKRRPPLKPLETRLKYCNLKDIGLGLADIGMSTAKVVLPLCAWLVAACCFCLVTLFCQDYLTFVFQGDKAEFHKLFEHSLVAVWAGRLTVVAYAVACVGVFGSFLCEHGQSVRKSREAARSDIPQSQTTV
jgi:hypothetical protein